MRQVVGALGRLWSVLSSVCMRRSLGLKRSGIGLLLFLVLAMAARAQETGILEGQVINGTADGPGVGAGLTVMLHTLRGAEEVDSRTTTTDAGGTFRFTGLDTDPALQYRLEVVYLGVSYSGAELYRFNTGQTALQARLTVFETTEDDQAIYLNSAHLILESFGQMLRVSEIQLLGNRGDRTYVGKVQGSGRRVTVSIPLPEGAIGLGFPEDTPPDRYLAVEGGLLDTEPVRPGDGSSLVFFSYHLAANDSVIPVEHRFDYPVAQLDVLVAQPGPELHSDRLQSRGIQLFEGRRYSLYTATNLDPVTPLRMELRVESDANSSEEAAVGAVSRGSQGLLRWLGLILTGLAVIGAAAYPAAVQRLRPPVGRAERFGGDGN